MNKKELLVISIGIFMTVIAWMIADLYHAATQEVIKNQIDLPKIQKYTLNNSILQTLKGKQQ